MSDRYFVERAMALLRSRGVDTWLFGGWASELRGMNAPRPHRDVDLLYPAENFDRVDELLGSLDEITAKHFPHKRAFELEGTMVELFLVRFDGSAHYTSFWNSYRYEWASDVFPADRIVGPNALADFRRNFDRIRASALTVRPAVAADAPVAVRMRDGAAAWQQQRGIDQWKVGETSAARFARRIEAGELYVAEQWDGRIVGMVTVVWSDEMAWGTQETPAGYIHGLVVDRASAGYGFGRLLLEWAEQHIFATGRRMARLDYVASNDALGRYYAAAGYRVVGLKTFPGTDWQPGALVEKRLPYVANIVVTSQSPDGPRVLLLHPSDVETLDGDWAWVPPGGCREPGEYIDECAARELREEIGLDVVAIPVETSDVDIAIYRLEIARNSPIRLSDEHTTFEWVDLDEACRRCRPDSVRTTIHKALTDSG